ncbi:MULTISPECIES: S8 family peptidase [Bacillaceae]|uniref:S8 family peptidase n=1 Tax=Bacillaceae TaxID=186817 RepID=UPI001E417D29|nr:MULTISPECIES: S8 family peptidase [Bacillaceae]MCE4051385.1 S8 family peptidase [Bacillus sp. Au-Bac7]MCM3029286.1 S8 family peptidase [Niallia sp. MER 6]MDL0436464.1 S8 family peptidase [Niallia sp. SS-2023]UPO88642.1 S8 family peptidase [Niallia sp. Man26]
MRPEVKVIPYKVEQVVQMANEVPTGIQQIQAPALWNKSKGKGIKVAILDTGCDTTHPDLQERIIGGYNFTDDDNSNPDIYSDYNGHGTHVAGTIGAVENNDGVAGAAPQVSLLIVKVLNGQGSGQYDWITNGIHYAIEQNVDIISMSLGGPDDVQALHDAVKRAVDNQILVVCAAGNEGDGRETTEELAYPAAYNEVISVGSVDFTRNSSEFSNSNREVDLAAPGENILSTYPGGQYARLSGTSMAAPHVSGGLALIKAIATDEFDRPLTEPELYAQLIKRTVPLGFSPKLEGNGLLYLTAPEKLAEAIQSSVTKMLSV